MKKNQKSSMHWLLTLPWKTSFWAHLKSLLDQKPKCKIFPKSHAHQFSHFTLLKCHAKNQKTFSCWFFITLRKSNFGPTFNSFGLKNPRTFFWKKLHSNIFLKRTHPTYVQKSQNSCKMFVLQNNYAETKKQIGKCFWGIS